MFLHIDRTQCAMCVRRRSSSTHPRSGTVSAAKPGLYVRMPLSLVGRAVVFLRVWQAPAHPQSSSQRHLRSGLIAVHVASRPPILTGCRHRCVQSRAGGLSTLRRARPDRIHPFPWSCHVYMSPHSPKASQSVIFITQCPPHHRRQQTLSR